MGFTVSSFTDPSLALEEFSRKPSDYELGKLKREQQVNQQKKSDLYTRLIIRIECLIIIRISDIIPINIRSIEIWTSNVPA
ncbi:MAG: hypothetical protein WCA39_11680 [Nitrososphaeraceae archaeon]